jgi:hypothetical protein
MKKPRGILVASILFVVLSAASCGPQTTDRTQITNLAIAREIGVDNQAILASDVVPASAPSIYLSGQVVRPVAGTKVRVSWLQLPNTTISTEDFSGSRSGGNLFDFDKTQTTSNFASKIDRTGIAWEEGEYRADAYLGNRLVDSLFFKVVSDSEADAANNKRVISKVSFGDSLSDNGHIAVSKTTFTRSTDHIYIQVALAGTQPGHKIEASVRYLKANQVINIFTTTTGRDDTLVFDLSLSQYGRLWTDKLWPSGGFQVDVKVNGTSATTPSFVIN